MLSQPMHGSACSLVHHRSRCCTTVIIPSYLSAAHTIGSMAHHFLSISTGGFMIFTQAVLKLYEKHCIQFFINNRGYGLGV